MAAYQIIFLCSKIDNIPYSVFRHYLILIFVNLKNTTTHSNLKKNIFFKDLKKIFKLS